MEFFFSSKNVSSTFQLAGSSRLLIMFLLQTKQTEVSFSSEDEYCRYICLQMKINNQITEYFSLCYHVVFVVNPIHTVGDF
jgi:hypothetical protein